LTYKIPDFSTKKSSYLGNGATQSHIESEYNNTLFSLRPIDFHDLILFLCSFSLYEFLPNDMKHCAVSLLCDSDASVSGDSAQRPQHATRAIVSDWLLSALELSVRWISGSWSASVRQ